MTAAERAIFEQELSRLEDLQLDAILDKKTGYVDRNHKKIQKLRRLLGRSR